MWVVVILCVAILTTAQPDCTKILDPSSGEFYDLSPIIGKELTLSDSFSVFKATICKNTYTTCGACGGPAGYCQTTEFWADCIGTFSTAIAMQGAVGVELLYDNGDWGSVGRIKISCDPTAGDEATNVKEQGNYKTMIVRSKHACLGPGGGGGAGGIISGISLGSAIIIALAVLVVLYVFSGVLWNHFRLQKSGIELVPHLEFWQEVPLLVKDGALYTVGTAQDLVLKVRNV